MRISYGFDSTPFQNKEEISSAMELCQLLCELERYEKIEFYAKLELDKATINKENLIEKIQNYNKLDRNLIINNFYRIDSFLNTKESIEDLLTKIK